MEKNHDGATGRIKSFSENDRLENGGYMNIVLLAALLLLAGCVGARTSVPNDRASTGVGTVKSTGAGTVQGTSAGDFNSDAADCEREAALSAAGGKAQAFANCMRARKHTPRR
jgi:hypothetical protein